MRSFQTNRRESDLLSRVSIVRVKNNKIKMSVYRALDLLNAGRLNNVNSVLIKPNLCHYYSSDTGITTDVQVVGYLIDYIRDRMNTNARIIIGEADATEMKANIAFKLLGYERLANQKKVTLLNLSQDKKVRVDGNFIKEIPATTKEVDLLITVPKLKTHTDVKMSCCLKNQFGAIPYWRKTIFHKNLHKVIVEAAKFMKPHICLVDGVIALEGMGPIAQGTPLRMNLIIAGNDPVATDYICTKIMGLSKVKYIEQAEKEGVGSTKNLEVVGEPVWSVRQKFRGVSPTLRLAMYANKFGLGSLAFILKRFSKDY